MPSTMGLPLGPIDNSPKANITEKKSSEDHHVADRDRHVGDLRLVRARARGR
jgi:hypothetical protein